MQAYDHEMNTDAIARIQGLWSGGDYRQIAARFTAVAEVLVEAVGAAEGVRLLDVATGSGNVALAAARRGAVVTGADVTPRMLELAREAAAAAGLTVTWIEAEASALPVPDAGLGAATSCFGVMFAPDPAAAAGELGRALRPGGRLGLASWSPRAEGDPFSDPLRRRFPQPPGAPDAQDWGRPEVVTERLAAAGFTAITTERRDFPWTFPNPEAAAAFVVEASPMHVALLSGLPEAERTAVRGEVRDAFAAATRPDGTVLVTNPWLLTTATRAG